MDKTVMANMIMIDKAGRTDLDPSGFFVLFLIFHQAQQVSDCLLRTQLWRIIITNPI